jgi:2',3'-cyclic-nucleotide 2'-phosphodiesterase/3'-nucleotidase
MTGAILRQYLEFSARYLAPWQIGQSAFAKGVQGYNFDMVIGVNYQIDVTCPEGQRIRNLSWQGSPVHDEQVFTVAMNSYRQGGGGGYEMLRQCPVIYSREENIRELIIDYLRARGAIEPGEVFQRNWRIVPHGVIDPQTFIYRAPWTATLTVPTGSEVLESNDSRSL